MWLADLCTHAWCLLASIVVLYVAYIVGYIFNCYQKWMLMKSRLKSLIALL